MYPPVLLKRTIIFKNIDLNMRTRLYFLKPQSKFKDELYWTTPTSTSHTKVQNSSEIINFYTYNSNFLVMIVPPIQNVYNIHKVKRWFEIWLKIGWWKLVVSSYPILDKISYNGFKLWKREDITLDSKFILAIPSVTYFFHMAVSRRRS